MLLPENIRVSLNKYIRKYYIYETFKGLVVFSIFFLLSYLILALYNYFFYPSVFFKTVTFWLYVLISLFFFSRLVLKNLFKFFNVLPSLTDIEAAKQISVRLHEIKDTLINLIELSYSNSYNDLVLASIKQKSKSLSFYDFSSILTFKDLKKYFFSFLTFILLFLLLYFLNKTAVTIGTKQFVNYTVKYTKPAPFSFTLLNKDLRPVQGQSFTINVKISGKYIPDNVYLVVGSNRLPMTVDKKNKDIFYSTLTNLNNNISFYFESDGYKSDIYHINVLPPPKITSFTVRVYPPAYLHSDPFTQISNGNLTLPYGSRVQFRFQPINVDTIQLLSDDFQKITTKNLNYSLSFNILKSSDYQVIVKNKYLSDTVFKYRLEVINDLYPEIKVSKIQDSNTVSLFYFIGSIKDDHGFKSLTFNFAVDSNRSYPNLKYQTIPLNVNQLSENQDFNFLFDFNDLKLKSGQTVYYFFKVRDNDVLNGYKATSTQVYIYQKPDIFQLDSLVSEIDSTTNDLLQQAKSLSNQISSDIENFQQKMLSENVTQWEKEDFIQNLLQKQNKLQTIADSIKKLNDQKLKNLQNTQLDSSLLQKQKEIQELLDKLITPEMKKLLDELKKLQAENYKDLEKTLQKTKLSTENFKNKINSTHELMKRMYIEQKTQNISNQLKELSKQADSLAQSIKKKTDLSLPKLDSMSNLQKQLDKLKSDYDSLQDLNKNLEKPYNLEDFDSSFNDIKNSIQKSFENFEQKNTKKTSKSLREASDKMEKLSQQMSQMMMSNMSSQNSEDEQTIKFLLTNLLELSFSQENLYNNTSKNYSFFSQTYKNLYKQQLKQKLDFSSINDSLTALASRNPIVAKFIFDELSNLNTNYNSVIDAFENKKKQKILISQRHIIKSLNRLSLMLQQSLENMQNSSQNMQGSGSPQPNKGSQIPGMQSVKQFQQSLQQQLEQMIQQMKEGNMPSSEELAKQLAEREAFQRMLEQLQNSGQMSQQASDILNQINKIEDEIKNDILNNNITPETLMKERNIQTRLLESEKANNKRKYSKKRVSKVGTNIQHTVPDEILKKYRKQCNTEENLYKSNIIIDNFYKNYYNDYIQQLKNK